MCVWLISFWPVTLNTLPITNQITVVVFQSAQINKNIHVFFIAKWIQDDIFSINQPKVDHSFVTLHKRKSASKCHKFQSKFSILFLFPPKMNENPILILNPSPTGLCQVIYCCGEKLSLPSWNRVIGRLISNYLLNVVASTKKQRKYF